MEGGRFAEKLILSEAKSKNGMVPGLFFQF
jgi:hypothetical protein